MSPWVTGKDVSAGVLGLPLLSTGSPNVHLPFHRPLAVSMLLGVFQGHTLSPASQHPGPISEGDRSAAHVSCIEMKHKQCSLNNNNNKNPVPIFMYLKEDGSKNLRKNNVFWLPILIVFLPKYFLGLESYWAFLCLLLKRNVMLLRVLWQDDVSAREWTPGIREVALHGTDRTGPRAMEWFPPYITETGQACHVQIIPDTRKLIFSNHSL